MPLPTAPHMAWSMSLRVATPEAHWQALNVQMCMYYSPTLDLPSSDHA